MKVLSFSVFSLLALGACSSSSSTILPTIDSGNPADSSSQDSTVAESGGGSDTSVPGNDAPTSSDAPAAADTSITDAGMGKNDAELAHCGQPGDMGNAMGIGKYCTTSSDCTGAANLCSTLGGPMSNFCTLICTPSDASNPCGSGATCVCQSLGCGCTPNYCLM